MKFEYLKKINPKMDELNKFGSEGWELITVMPSYNGANSVPEGREFYFKRTIKD